MSDTPSSPLNFNSLDEMRQWIAENHPELYEARNSKFAPKLTVAERCEIYALCKEGTLDKRAIAAAYGINRGTLGHINNENGKHYRDVRKMYKELGHERFLRKYITPTVIERYLLGKEKQETLYSRDELAKAIEEGTGPATGPNPKATKNAGVFYFTSLMYKAPVKAEVLWVDNPGPDLFSAEDRTSGWYVQVFHEDTEAWPPDHCHGTPENSKTSTSAKTQFLAAIVGQEVEE